MDWYLYNDDIVMNVIIVRYNFVDWGDSKCFGESVCIFAFLLKNIE